MEILSKIEKKLTSFYNSVVCKLEKTSQKDLLKGNKPLSWWRKLTNIIKIKVMEWFDKTKSNIKQLLWVIPAIFDVRNIIGLGSGVIFTIFAFNATEVNYKIIWTVFAALGNGIFIRYLLEYFGHYPLKEKLIENIKTLYSVNDFLIKRKNVITDTNLKQLYDFKINEINLGIQRWGDKIKMADIEKIKNEIKRVENSHDANKEIFEIDITELRNFGISNDIIADFSGTTIQNVNKIIKVHKNTEELTNTNKYVQKTIGKPRGNNKTYTQHVL